MRFEKKGNSAEDIISFLPHSAWQAHFLGPRAVGVNAGGEGIIVSSFPSGRLESELDEKAERTNKHDIASDPGLRGKR